MESFNYKYKLGFIGAGNMAQAIAKATISSNILSADDIIMADPYAHDNYCGIKCVLDCATILHDCEYLVLAVKPQIYRDIKDVLSAASASCVISIMAGISLADLTATMPNALGIVRVMPNSPSMVQRGMTAIALNNSATQHKSFLNDLFGAIGSYVYIDESLFDTVTAISGSGPAYYYMFMQAMIEYAVEHGIDYNIARKLVSGTAIGAASMVAESSTAIEALINAVCSKGGTTIEAVEDFRKNDLSRIVKSATDKARNRSIELGKQ